MPPPAEMIRFRTVPLSRQFSSFFITDFGSSHFVCMVDIFFLALPQRYPSHSYDLISGPAGNAKVPFFIRSYFWYFEFPLTVISLSGREGKRRQDCLFAASFKYISMPSPLSTSAYLRMIRVILMPVLRTFR